MNIHFYLRFHTEFGQSLWLSGEENQLGGEALVPLVFLNEEFWHVSIEIPGRLKSKFSYKYLLQNKDNEIIPEWGDDRVIEPAKPGTDEIIMVDTWNHAGEYENVFYLSPYHQTLLKDNATKLRIQAPKSPTHIFKIKAPLLKKNEVPCLVGSCEPLGSWSKEKPLLLAKDGNWWKIKTDLSLEKFPLAYKYGVYNIREEKFVRFEEGDNRLLQHEAGKDRLTILQDGFIHLPNNTWKGAGVAIPVFSLRSRNSFGVGEFNDLKLLGDWAKKTGLKLVQILPVNDTTSTNTWTDSYPYAAISAFALHPLYINLEKVAGKEHWSKLKPLKKKQKQLNELAEIDYEQVMKFKIQLLRELYEILKDACFESEDYKAFFENNRHWLKPYAVFCYLRDKYETADFEKWRSDSLYDKHAVEKLCSSRSKHFSDIAFHFFVQYHLHLQLKEAADYLHKNGIVLKGDIPIGISRNSCDAWVSPCLYNMNMQAGAPPDDFAVKGQNWGFPTYDWKHMQQDGFAWWKLRFEQMSNYFDAFRIDHILGFFRIWSIPRHAVEGIMGRFVPAIPVSITEFGEKSIWFDYHRYCKPYITEEILWQLFGENTSRVKEEFLDTNEFGTFDLKPAYETQRQVELYFNSIEQTEDDQHIMPGLFDLISNLVLFEEEGSQGTKFHFRIAMDQTLSFKLLDWHTQEKLKELYINYFFHRQDDFWKKEAMHKLPQLKAATNMLICGEDLGMVPHCVPDVMKQLGILSLEIQRMPKKTNTEFFYLHEAPYLSVVTPSSHDMSTIRGWWEEDRGRTRRFYNQVMGQWGEAPYFCEAWINRAIVLQHLYSPAMWSIFQLQDILGMDETIRRQNPNEERINIPAIPNYYWRYRMHLSLEDLIRQTEFNEELRGYVVHCGRG